MKQYKEKEFKKIVSKQEFKQEKSFFIGNNEYEGNKIINQNFYFDTQDNYYFNHNISIKIRKNYNGYTLCFKEEKRNINGIRESNELLESINEKQFNNFILYNDIPDMLYNYLVQNMMPTNIIYKGYLVTNRMSFIHKRTNVLICFDKNNYLDFTDYEIEIEFNSDADLGEKAEVLKKSNCIAKSKYQRFVKRYLKKVQNNNLRVQTSAIIINDNNQVLLIKKRNIESSIRNMFIPPGGHIDYFESPYESIIREVYEETDLKILKKDLRLSSIVNFYNKEFEKQSICFFFCCLC